MRRVAKFVLRRANVIKPCKSYGMLNLLGHRAVDKAARIVGQQQRYYDLLDRRGVGLYILLFAAR